MKKIRDIPLKILLTLVVITFGLITTAQVDTTRVRQKINAYGYDYNNIGILGSFKPPSDTFHLAIADTGSIATIGNKMYVWNLNAGTLKWDLISGSGGGSEGPTAIIKNANYGGYSLLNFHNSVDSVIAKQLVAGTGITIDTTANTITINSTGGSGWLIAGNTLSADGIIGSLSNHDVHLYTNNVKRGEFTNDGNFNWNTASNGSYKWNIQDTANFLGIRVGGVPPAISGKNAQLAVTHPNSTSADYVFSLYNPTQQLFSVDATGTFWAPVMTNIWTPAAYYFRSATGTLSSTNTGTTTGSIMTILAAITTTTIGTTNTQAVSLNGAYTSGGTSTGMWRAVRVRPTVTQTLGGTQPTAGMVIEGVLTDVYDYAALRVLDSGAIKTNGPIFWGNKKAPATSGNYTVTALDHFIYLQDLTTPAANRTVTMPTPLSEGMELVVYNTSADATYKWSFGGATVLDAAGATITTMTDQKSYLLRYYYGNWRIISVY